MEDSASVKFYFCMSEKKILHGFLFNIYLYIAFVVLYGCPKARAPAQKVKALMAIFSFSFSFSFFAFAGTKTIYYYSNATKVWRYRNQYTINIFKHYKSMFMYS